VAGSGHVDIVGVLLLLYPSPHWCAAGVRLQPWRLAGYFIENSFRLSAAALWKRVRKRDAALAAIAVGLL